MTDEELIAEMRRVGLKVRHRDGDLDRLAGWLMLEAAGRLEGRPAAQDTEDNHG